MSVLSVKRHHPAPTRQRQQALDGGHRALGLLHDQGAAGLDEVVLHVHNDQRGRLGIDNHAALDLIFRRLDGGHLSPHHAARALRVTWVLLRWSRFPDQRTQQRNGEHDHDDIDNCLGRQPDGENCHGHLIRRHQSNDDERDDVQNVPTRIVNDATSWFRRPTTPAVNPMMVWGMIAANSYGAAPVPKNTAFNEVPTSPVKAPPAGPRRIPAITTTTILMAMIAPPPTIGFGIRTN